MIERGEPLVCMGSGNKLKEQKKGPWNLGEISRGNALQEAVGERCRCTPER